MSDWDEDSSRGRGRGPREGRAGDGTRSERREYDRPARGGSTSSWDSDRPDRGERGLTRERDDANPRTSSGGWERPRSSQRGNDETWDADARRSNGANGRGRSSAGDYDDDRSGSRSRPPRNRRDDPYDGRSDRSPRPPRSPGRDDWDARDRRGGPGASMSRGGPTPRSGLWANEDMPRRRRPDMSDPRARSAGGYDPRGLRKGLVDTTAHAAPPKSRFGIGKAILIILLMFLIGAGAGYGYFRLSAPAVHGPTPSAPGATPSSGTPGAGVTPSASPHSNVPAAHPLDVVL